MTLETMTPAPGWAPEEHASALSVLEPLLDRMTVRVWCGDWCGDCHRLLPPFAAALEALGVTDSAIHVFAVEKLSDGSKVGEAVEAYSVDRTPTVVVSIEGEEVARFEEGRTEPPILEALAATLDGNEVGAGQS